jgi:hypothetical protein
MLVRLFVRMEQLGSHWTDFYDTILDVWVLFDNLSWHFKLHQNRTRMTTTLHKEQSTILTISCSFLCIMINISKKYRENQNTHFMFNVLFFRKTCRLWDNVEKYCKDGQVKVTIRRRRIACTIPKSINTHAEYLILTAFPVQQWLHERASMLRYTCIVCLVPTLFFSENPSRFFFSKTSIVE